MVLSYKKIKLNGVKNNDWEELTQDKTHFYLGDFGNNASGNRTDLTIYKIAKTHFLTIQKLKQLLFLIPNKLIFPNKKATRPTLIVKLLLPPKMN
jgi:hypothetical protein